MAHEVVVIFYILYEKNNVYEVISRY